jgi:hypothetical protein
MFPTQNPNVVSQGLAHLTSRFVNQPNIKALLTAYLGGQFDATTATWTGGVQELQDTLWDVIQLRWLVFAASDDTTGLVSDQLDKIGALVGQQRTGLTNGLFGMVIFLRIQANRSQGRAEDILKLAEGIELVGKRLGAGVSILPDPGTNPSTSTTAAFVQPAVLATVPVEVGDTDWMFVGEILDIIGGGQYQVDTIDSPTQATLINTGANGNAAPTTTIPIGAEVTGSVAVNYLEFYPAGFLVEILDLTIAPFIAISLLRAAKPLGVHGTLHYSDEGETLAGVFTSVHDATVGHGVWQDVHTSDPPGIVPVAHWVASTAI